MPQKKDKKNKDLAARFDLPKSTITRILNEKENVLSAIEKGGSAKRARVNKDSDLNESLLIWIKLQRSNNIPLDGPTIRVCFYMKNFQKLKMIGKSPGNIEEVARK
jgi:hypothetical protein